MTSRQIMGLLTDNAISITRMMKNLNDRENAPKFHTSLQMVTQRCSVWNLHAKKLELADDCK